MIINRWQCPVTRQATFRSITWCRIERTPKGQIASKKGYWKKGHFPGMGIIKLIASKLLQTERSLKLVIRM